MNDEIVVKPKENSSIIQDLKNKIDNKESVVEKPLITTEPATNEVDGDKSLLKIEIANILGIKDIHDTKFIYVFDSLYNNNPSKGALMEAIRIIERKTGTPRFGLGENKLGLIYNYIKAENAINDAIKVRNSYLE